MKTEDNYHTRFPLKKCLIATLVIILCAARVLTLLYAIVKNEQWNEKSWIFVLIWGIVFGLRLIFYWGRQIRKFIHTRHDENEK